MKYQTKTIRTKGFTGMRDLAKHLNDGWEVVAGVGTRKGNTTLRRVKEQPVRDAFKNFLEEAQKHDHA